MDDSVFITVRLLDCVLLNEQIISSFMRVQETSMTRNRLTDQNPNINEEILAEGL
jgi:hypothetical protein